MCWRFIGISPTFLLNRYIFTFAIESMESSLVFNHTHPIPIIAFLAYVAIMNGKFLAFDPTTGVLVETDSHSSYTQCVNIARFIFPSFLQQTYTFTHIFSIDCLSLTESGFLNSCFTTWIIVFIIKLYGFGTLCKRYTNINF